MEVLIALGILGAIGGAYLYALSTGFFSSGQVDEFAMAERLARNQIESIKNEPYDETLPLEYSIVDYPQDYSISVDIVPGGEGDAGTYQEITVNILHGGENILSVGHFKVKGL